MQITISVADILTAAGIVVPVGCGAVYWSVRMAIRDAVQRLELRVSESYVGKAACQRIRDECEHHREQLAAAGRAKR